MAERPKAGVVGVEAAVGVDEDDEEDDSGCGWLALAGWLTRWLGGRWLAAWLARWLGGWVAGSCCWLVGWLGGWLCWLMRLMRRMTDDWLWLAALAG